MNAVAEPSTPTEDPGASDWRAGVELAGNKRWREAVRAFGRATRAAPQDAVYWLNLAHAQRHAGALPRAAAAARRGLQHKPGDRITLRLLGECQMQMHRYAEAEQTLAQLDVDGAGEPDALLQRASVMLSLQRPAEAAALLLRALTEQPDMVAGHGLLADACRDLGRKREAVECIKTVLALKPGDVEALSRLSFEKRHLCDWSELDADIDAICEALQGENALRPRVTAAFAMLSLPLPPQLQATAARCEALGVARGVVPLPAVTPADRQGRKPRLGWVSYDFRDHAVSQLLVEVLEAIDRERFDVVLYSSGPDDRSPLRARLAALAEFVDLRGMSDKQAAQRIRADGIDLLVDLMGHTRGHRMGIFARRPAPLQVGFLGYPGSTGAAFIDYVIGDPLVTPLALAPQYTEKLAQLPLTFQPNGRGRPVPGQGAPAYTRQQAGLPEGAFVMCAFNHTYKILPPAFDAWCAVLRELPHAVLWLKETNGQLRENVLREAAARGVASARIVFAPPLPYDVHFARLALSDVFVDTWPYNAHTTASDALWAGVPVVTLYGNGYASRVAASVLNAAGIGELAFETVADYRLAITALGTDAALRDGYKRHLTEQRMALPLFDTARYTRELEALLARMIERWRLGQPAEHLPAAIS